MTKGNAESASSLPVQPSWRERIMEQIRLSQIKRRLKAALRRKPRPARTIPKDDPHAPSQ
jgi:hypothetical protein